jgi:hypothetical protein
MPGRALLAIAAIAFATSLPVSAATSCVSITDAAKHIGATKCVSGKVVRVKQGSKGTHFFDFCENYQTCPFTVVVFASDLKQIGDVRRLEGRQIEIDGEIKSYDGRAEIILHRASQLRCDAAHIPPLPKQYDVERKGKFSAGKFSYPRQTKGGSRKKESPPISLQDPSLSESPTD